MNDLISRKALLKGFWEFANGGKQRYLIPEEIWEMIELTPTAYDPDKVVEVLEDYAMWKGFMIYDLTDREIKIIRKAIEIVKKGGMSDED